MTIYTFYSQKRLHKRQIYLCKLFCYTIQYFQGFFKIKFCFIRRGNSMIIKWGFTVLLMGLFLWVLIFNWSVVWRRYIRHEEKVPSIGPIIGGVSGFIALRVCPLPGVSTFSWIPLFLDVGCIPYIVLFLWSMLTGKSD